MTTLKQKLANLSVEEFLQLINQVVETQLKAYLPAFQLDEEGFRIAAATDSEDSLELKPDFAQSLQRSIQEAKKGIVTGLAEVRKKHGF